MIFESMQHRLTVKSIIIGVGVLFTSQHMILNSPVHIHIQFKKITKIAFKSLMILYSKSIALFFFYFCPQKQETDFFIPVVYMYSTKKMDLWLCFVGDTNIQTQNNMLSIADQSALPQPKYLVY